MPRKFTLLTTMLLLAAAQLLAIDESTLRLLDRAWAGAPVGKMTEIGRGVGVVFSPDLSVQTNCRFYQALGFACFQESDWERVLDQIHRHNALYPERRIATLVLETHGTNGNGLKLQDSYDPKGGRSYISVGALQERLEPEGVFYVVISACNSGRLLRPSIYNKLDASCGDKLFLPATNGIVNASDEYDPRGSAVTIITPQSSHIETTLVGSLAELRPATHRAILAAAEARGVTPPKEFAVSDMMVQMITRDANLELAAGNVVEELSKDIRTQATSEALFKRFTGYLNAVAARESPPAKRSAARKRIPAKSASSTPRN
jgi:hypothetical protein